jgi:alpha-galactosidase
MPEKKCTIIGAGSAFAFHVTGDLIARPDFAGSTIGLVDIDEGALAASTQTIRRMIDESGAALQVEASTKRAEILPGSDFVLNSISVGEPWARERDVTIGERHGIYQPTSQTVGPAGLMRGLRVLPHAVAIAEDIAGLCPEATVLNLTNPLAAVCHAMQRYLGLEVIGLCEQWAYTMPFFAEVLDVPEAELTCQSVGTNHLTWALGLYYQGEDVLSRFIERLYSPEGRAFRERVPVSCEIFEAFGLWPTGTEAHIAEFFNYFLTPEADGGAAYGLEIRHTSEADWEARMAQRRGWADGSLPIDELLTTSGESAVPIMASLSGIEPPQVEVVNVPNQGLIDNLPWEAVVELPARISPAGVQGLKVGYLPEPVAHIVRTRTVQQELLADAGEYGDYQRALQAMLLDAQIVSLDVAQEILDASLEANAEWLPMFQEWIETETGTEEER